MCLGDSLFPPRKSKRGFRGAPLAGKLLSGGLLPLERIAALLPYGSRSGGGRHLSGTHTFLLRLHLAVWDSCCF